MFCRLYKPYSKQRAFRARRALLAATINTLELTFHPTIPRVAENKTIYYMDFSFRICYFIIFTKLFTKIHDILLYAREKLQLFNSTLTKVNAKKNLKSFHIVTGKCVTRSLVIKCVLNSEFPYIHVA